MGLETVEFVMDAEDYFHVRVPDAAAAKCITVDDFLKVIVELLGAQGREQNETLQREVWEGLITIFADNGYDVTEIRPESRWVGDITDYG